jgi:hypothetical protein
MRCGSAAESRQVCHRGVGPPDCGLNVCASEIVTLNSSGSSKSCQGIGKTVPKLRPAVLIFTRHPGLYDFTECVLVLAVADDQHALALSFSDHKLESICTRINGDE